MNLERLVHSVESRLFGWLGNESRELETDQRRELLARLRDEQSVCHRLRCQRGSLVDQIEALTQEVVLFPSRIESSLLRHNHSQAMRQSIELERLRRELTELRDQLNRLDDALFGHEFRLRRLRQQLNDLPEPVQKVRPR